MPCRGLYDFPKHQLVILISEELLRTLADGFDFVSNAIPETSVDHCNFRTHRSKHRSSADLFLNDSWCFRFPKRRSTINAGEIWFVRNVFFRKQQLVILFFETSPDPSVKTFDYPNTWPTHVIFWTNSAHAILQQISRAANFSTGCNVFCCLDHPVNLCKLNFMSAAIKDPKDGGLILFI